MEQRPTCRAAAACVESRACCLLFRAANTAAFRAVPRIKNVVAFCFVSVNMTSQVNLGEQRVVTAILVLCGLPYASFSSVLAHEATHAWMKLDPGFSSHLPAQARGLLS